METFPDIDGASYIEANIKILRFFIYWPPDTNDRFTRYLYYIYYTFSLSIVMVFFNIVEYVNFALVYGDLEKMIEISFLMFTNTTQLSKVAIFIYYSGSIKKSVDWMKDKIFKPRTKAHYEILKKQMDNYWKIWISFMVICATTCLMWALFPFIDDKIKDKGLPFDYYYPYDRTGTIAYPITFLYQSLGMLIHAITHAALDCLYAGMMAFVGAQIDILNSTLANLHKTGVLGENVMSETVDKSRRMNDNLIYCVHRHWSILRLIEKLKLYIAFTTLIQFGMAGVILCVAMYNISTLPPTSGKFISSFFYFMSMVTQLSVYCWHGNEIVIKSDLLSSSIYKCDWTDTNQRFKKNMLLFTLMAASPSKIYAGYFITLSLSTFGGILKASWSYFAVLKNVQE